MIVFKYGIVYIFTLFLIVVLIILWEIGEINGKEIAKRGLIDNINSGIRFAGQILGINNAVDVANLVAKAFATNEGLKSPQASHKPSDLTEYLNTGETRTSNKYQDFEQINKNENEEQQSSFNTSLMIANMLKLMGLDTAKLGAVALNVIIVIAQMIGNAFIQTSVLKVPGSPDQILDLESRQLRKKDDSHKYKNEKKTERKIVTGSPFDWILENPSEKLTNILNNIRDEKLLEYIINQVNEMEHESGDGDCIKMLICKSQPFFLSMQKQVVDRIDGNANEENVNENIGEMFYKVLPNLTEFKKNEMLCEKKFQNCSFLARTR